MKIDKQLFEDVLSGKLKGTFVLRNGDKVKSSKLSIDTNTHTNYPISLNGYWYANQGEFSLTRKCNIDIIDFIPDIDMKETELTIEIPDGKIVDWEESKKQNKIVLKDKQLTYEDVCKKLFDKYYYCIDKNGTVEHIFTYHGPYHGLFVGYKNNAATEHQLECILAKNKLANVAKYLNDGWNPAETGDIVYYLSMDLNDHIYISSCSIFSGFYFGKVVFKSVGFAQQAIEILGKETVKLALEPLGI